MGQPSSTTSGKTEPPSLQGALAFATEAHSGQRRRQNGLPFIQHPAAVVELLAREELSDEVLAAGYLHDTVEKCEPVTLEQIDEHFGPAVTAIVAALSEDPSIDGYDARKRALRHQALGAGRDAIVVYAADRLANMNDWRALAPEERPGAAERLGTALPERLELWEEDLRALHEFDEELPFLAEIEIALGELR